MTFIMSLVLLVLQPGQYFSLQVEQDGRVLPVKGDQVVLARKPFTLVLRMREPRWCWYMRPTIRKRFWQ
jgi:hypothetical protein